MSITCQAGGRAPRELCAARSGGARSDRDDRVPDMARDTLTPEMSPEEREKALREALARMFQNYPPRAK